MRFFRYNRTVKRILLYGLDDAAADRTQIILERIGIAAYIIGDDVLDENVDEVFNAQEDFDGRHQEFSSAFLLFDGMKPEELLPVLQELEIHGQPFDGVKIMLNQTNAGWTFRKLFEETYREHELAKKVLVLQELISSCSGINVSNADNKSKSEFRRSLVDALTVLKSGSYNEEAVDNAIHNLTESMKGVRKLYN